MRESCNQMAWNVVYIRISWCISEYRKIKYDVMNCHHEVTITGTTVSSRFSAHSAMYCLAILFCHTINTCNVFRNKMLLLKYVPMQDKWTFFRKRIQVLASYIFSFTLGFLMHENRLNLNLCKNQNTTP